MAKKKEAPVTDENSVAPRARLHKLSIRNFRSIGKVPVEIELDDIVVLVGANNTGKSSILRAYQLVMDASGELTLDDFPAGIQPKTEDEFPSIELETVLYDDSNAPAERWIDKKENGDRHVRERWVWTGPGRPAKRGYDVQRRAWDADHGPWGAPQVAQINRPEAHRIEAFDDPKKQAEGIIDLLTEAIKERLKEVSATADGEGDYARLLEAVKKLQKSVAADALSAIDTVKEELSSALSHVFPGFTISLDARPEDNVAKSISFFKAPPVLKMGPASGHQSDLERQGSGTRRTLLWNALRIIADHKRARKNGAKTSDRPHLLLLDEPELCLHPNAIRDACKVLYSLPAGGTWQVMVTTHSPAFIDLSRDNTSIIRVERDEGGSVCGTTIFRPARANLGKEDKERLKLLNMYDPYVAEFFFGGRTVVVEGDTEYTAFREIMEDFPQDFRDVHVVRARGKYTIVSLCKILNQFNCTYAVLHDADTTTIAKDIKAAKNPAWAANVKIQEEVAKARPGTVRLVASLHNFEQAMFKKRVSGEKPYQTWLNMRNDEIVKQRVKELLAYLIGKSDAYPHGVMPWSSEAQLAAAVAEFEPRA